MMLALTLDNISTFKFSENFIEDKINYRYCKTDYSDHIVKVKNDIIFLDNFDDSVINDHLYTRNLPDVDLLIRTSGEQRISNFLLFNTF